MQFDSWQQFFAMGGYGFYVWLCFGFTFGCILLLVLATHRQKRSIRQQIIQREARLLRLQQAKKSDLL